MLTNRISQLTKATAQGGGYFRVEASGDEPSIYLYTMIGKAYDWETGDVVGMSDMDFVQALEECRGAPIVHLRVNSPGGDVFQMKAMQTAIMQYQGKIVAHVDSLAASAAAGLIMYADSIEMSTNAFLMIHKAWTFAIGNADDFRDYASKMDQFDASLAADYARKSGLEPDEIMEMMAQTTYIDAKTAKKKGFCDSILEPKPEKEVENSFDLSVYGWIPEPLRVVKKDGPKQALDNGPKCDRAQIERRLRLIERIAS